MERSHVARPGRGPSARTHSLRADRRRTAPEVAVFGAGIAGLTVAHELARRGWRVRVFEATAEAGGFFRSARLPPPDNLPTEYSWHGFGPWYHNAFAVLRGIPGEGGRSLYETALSRPIDFGIFRDDASAEFYDRRLRSIRRMFGFTWSDLVRWWWLMLKTWTADRRSLHAYARRNAASAWCDVLSARAARTWRSCFGPWIGSDWTRVSLHTTGRFFCRQLTTRPRHLHPADGGRPPWRHGAGDGWLLLRGPSSEVWFDPWVAHLVQLGVEFHWRQPLRRLEYGRGRIVAGELESGRRVRADYYVVAANPFAVAGILDRTPALRSLRELRKFRPLVQDGPHVQVSFRIAFSEPIRFPRERTAVVVADSEFNLTLFAQEQAWGPGVDLGTGVRSLWTGTSCAGTVPGRLFGLPVTRCTRAQFIAEVWSQIRGCGALDRMVREANAGRGLADFTPQRMEIWPEWRFSPDGLRGPQPKWVTSTTTQPHLPDQRTPVANLVLAGAHTRTAADVWSIEGAVESGRRAARLLAPPVDVRPQYTPPWLRAFRAADNLSFRCGGPHVLDLLLALAAVVLARGLLYVLIGVSRPSRTVPRSATPSHVSLKVRYGASAAPTPGRRLPASSKSR